MKKLLLELSTNKRLISKLKKDQALVKKVLDVYDVTLTAWENLDKNGYDRIWDCGYL